MEGLYDLNQIRQDAGMMRFTQNGTLQEAAQNHSEYLAHHYESSSFVSAHSELSHLSGFTGENPASRVKKVGYLHAVVRENVTVGESDMAGAIDGLMGAIYHRFAFLDFAADEVGIASKDEAFVFEMGRSDLASLCRFLPEESLLQKRIQCGEEVVTEAFYQGLCVNLPQEAVFKAPWSHVCPNGTKLNADYMNDFCVNPPKEALFEAHGRYYSLCDKKVRIKAAWFDNLCEHPPYGAKFQGGERYYKLCGTKVKNAWLEVQCRQSPAPKTSGFYRDLCATGDKVRVDYIDQQTHQQQVKNPDIVYWPAPGSSNIPPAFYQEDPDPLPDYDVSGYPISLQVNPILGKRVQLKYLKLFQQSDDHGWFRVTDTRLLDLQTDPHAKFTSHQFALMPLKRLEWSATYKVESLVIVDGQTYEKTWIFKTRSQGQRPISLLQQGQLIKVKMNQSVLLYRPPTKTLSYTMKDVSIRYPSNIKVTMDSVDLNTLKYQMIGSGCGQVKMTFSDGFYVLIGGVDC